MTKTTRIMSAEGSQIVRELLNGAEFLRNNDDEDFSEFRGFYMDADNATALAHTVDSFLDHLGRSTAPNLTFHLGEFVNLGNNPRYRARGEALGNRFFTHVHCNYEINDRAIKSDYFCIDNIYFEMFPHTSEDGTLKTDYGVSWMRIYFSEAGVEQFVNKFTNDTGRPLRDSLFVRDEEQGLVSTFVKLDANNPPSWKVMAVPAGEFEEDHPDIQNIEISNRGGFKNILSDPDLHGIYRGTGIFSSTFNVVVDGDDLKKATGIDGGVRLTLVGVRIFGRENNLRKVGSRGIRDL